MGLFTPAWRKDNEAAAIKAIQKEKKVNNLHVATRVAPSYRVRAIAYEKLGNLQGARYEIALHSPDEAECLAALDGVDWDGWDQELAGIAMRSTKEAVADKAFGLVKDEAVLVDVIFKATSEQSALRLLDMIEKAGALKPLSGDSRLHTLPAPVRFEVGRRVGDCEICVSALGDIFAKGTASSTDAALSALGTIEDEELLIQVVGQWLETAEDPLGIFGRLWQKTIVSPRVAKSLQDYFCPDGHLHDLEFTSYFVAADSDERIGRVRCRNCGYLYTVDGSVLLHGKKCGYMFRPAKVFGQLSDLRHIVCEPGSYQCESCGAIVRAEGGSPAPCVCPTCGAENHDWEHVNGEIVHRDYSSGSSYDVCRRCGKQTNIVIHGGW